MASTVKTALLIFDILMGLGAAMDAKWALDGVVDHGSHCTAQGKVAAVQDVCYSDKSWLKAVVKQLGNVGVAW